MNSPITRALSLIENGSQTVFLVGNNGSGKSRLLSELATHFLRRRTPVIAIANSVLHRFHQRSNKFSKLSPSQGQRYAEAALKSALISERKSSRGDTKRIAQVFEYCGFDTSIGIKLEGARDIGGRDFTDLLGELPERQVDVANILSSWNLLRSRTEGGYETVINLTEGGYRATSDAQITDLIRYESDLRRAGLIERVSLFISKGGNRFELSNASSGELTLIATFAFLATHLSHKSVVLIDEPENSLHPQWQKEYHAKLLDLLYLFSPRVFIATHSAIVVSGAEAGDPRCAVFNLSVDLDEQPIKIEVEQTTLDESRRPQSVEETLWENFQTLTPSNHYLSEMIATLLARLNSDEVTLEEVSIQIDELATSSYDSSQKEFLSAVRALAAQISEEPVKLEQGTVNE